MNMPIGGAVCRFAQARPTRETLAANPAPAPRTARKTVKWDEHYELRDLEAERHLQSVDVPQACGQLPERSRFHNGSRTSSQKKQRPDHRLQPTAAGAILAAAADNANVRQSEAREDTEMKNMHLRAVALALLVGAISLGSAYAQESRLAAQAAAESWL